MGTSRWLPVKLETRLDKMDICKFYFMAKVKRKRRIIEMRHLRRKHFRNINGTRWKMTVANIFKRKNHHQRRTGETSSKIRVALLISYNGRSIERRSDDKTNMASPLISEETTVLTF